MAVRAQVYSMFFSMLFSQIIPSLKLYLHMVLSGEKIIAYGLSLITFGMVGYVWSTSIIVIPVSFKTIFSLKKISLSKMVKALLLFSITLYFSTVIVLIVGINNFLSWFGLGIPGIYVQGHLEAFIIGLVLSSTILSIGFTEVDLTLHKILNPYESLNIKEVEKKVLLKIAKK